MNKKEINQLLENFYNGMTSAEEEKILKDFFHSSHLKEEWQDEKELFDTYLQLSDIPLPEGLEERLSKHISSYAKEKKRFSLHPYPLRIVAAAAVILLCIGFFIGNLQNQEERTADTFKDPAQAAIVAEEALTLLSRQLNTGLGQLKEAQKEFDKINNIVYNQLNDQ